MAGRRRARLDDESAWVFNRLASDYRWRPGYPASVVRALVDLARSGRAVDLGAGTGHLAIPLSKAGAKVTAVEPARLMLDALVARAEASGASVVAVHASAEHTGLPARSFELALVADALHWVDPELAGKEIGRLLAPEGAVAVVEVELRPSEFVDALWPKVVALNPKARRQSRGAAALRQLLSEAVPGSRPESLQLDDQLSLSVEEASGVLRSLSFLAPAVLPERLAELCRWAEDFARTGGAVWSRRHVVHWARSSVHPESLDRRWPRHSP